MSIQIPNSIKPIASSLASAVVKYKVQQLEDLPTELQISFENKCDHELYYQDASRYMGDVYREAVNSGRIPCEPW